MINKPYSKVTIELKENFNLNEIKDILSKNGETKVKLVIKNKNQNSSLFTSKYKKI